MLLIKLYKKYPAYAILQISTIFTSLSSWAGFLAMLVLLDKLTDSGIGFGSLWAMSGLVPLLFGYFIGVWIDRFDVKTLLFWTEVFSAIGYVFFLLIFYFDGPLNFLLFFVARFLILLAGNVNSTCKSTVIPQIVEQEDLTTVNSLSFSINNIIRLSGASLGGVMLATSSLNTIWMINIVAFLIASFLAIVSQKYYSSLEKEPYQKNYFREFKEGFSFLRSNRWVLSVVLTAICTGILIGSFNLMLQQFTAKIYHQPNHVLSYLYVAQGLVSAIFAFWLAKRNFQFENRLYYGITYVLFGFSWMSFGLTNTFFQGILVLTIFAILGAFNGPYERTTMQNEIPAQLRGRVFSIWGTTYSVSIQLGAFLTGIIISTFGIRFVPYITGFIESLLGLSIILLSLRFGGKINYGKGKN